MNNFTDKEILQFAKANLRFLKIGEEMYLDEVCGGVGSVLGDVVDVKGNVGSVIGDVRLVARNVDVVLGSVLSVSGDVGKVGGSVESTNNAILNL